MEKNNIGQEISCEGGSERMADVYERMQRGLVYPAPYARFVAFWSNNPSAITRELIREVVIQSRAFIQANCAGHNTSAIVGMDFALFRNWCETNSNLSEPEGMRFIFPDDSGNNSSVFERSSGSFESSGADLWFHIKSDNEDFCETVHNFIAEQLADVVDSAIYQSCNSRPTHESPDGKVLGCRFTENLNNPADPVTVANHTLVSHEDSSHAGASYVLAQRFKISWEQLHNMTEEQIEDIIGRTSGDVILPSHDSRSHIKAARVRDSDGNSQFVMRLGLPYGQSNLVGQPEFADKGSNLRDEEGIYFAGFAKSVRVLESIMNNQIGSEKGFMRDRLLNNVKSNLGGFFYIPSRLDLGLDVETWDGRAVRDWKHFPGVDWSRLSRHFQESSANGQMFYNHKNYLYEMSTAGIDEKRLIDPPSTRILTLLMDMFSRWQDTWYFEKNQAEMGHLCEYLAKDFDEQTVNQAMGASLMVRKGWATRMTSRLYTSEEYGRSPRKVYVDNDDPGHSINLQGADTYRIHPLDLIVGALPDLSLGQGRYVMEYLLPHEKMPSFFSGLTEASGVGHVLPDHQKLVDDGLGKIISDIESLENASEDAAKKDFYRACVLSLQGVQDHLISFAELAETKADNTAAGQVAERHNLQSIAERLRTISHSAPSTMLEAAQLIFTYHTCLHMNGEPVSIGRLDQYLGRFCDADIAAGRLTESGAQEIIDALWVKLDEKVLQNRTFIKDHQPYGNLAMGGGSGPYPQGASLGQWIMQVTVGGVDKSGRQASNLVTRLCLRASARLPLNAPCLSLRVSKKMSREILEEAAVTILSGGAHPVLLNDDKIIPGMVASGDGIGGGIESEFNPHVPVSSKASGKWNATVAIESARNYSCDGCYEPMFTGENWFTLGGFSTLDPLECALNQGRLYASAGPTYLQGQNHSFRSRPAVEINDFEELLQLYFDHFYMLAAKSLDGQLSTFDALANFCPAPLLSVLTNSCLDKGLDIHGGGARYNVYGPCWIGLSSTINSLYNIKKMVFDPESAITSLPELVECLLCDWGNKMVEPFISSLIGPVRAQGKAERWQRGREYALKFPKYGRGNAEVDELGNRIIEKLCEMTVKVFTEPVASTAEKMLNYANKYGSIEMPFGGFQIQPGIGTFENFAAFGAGSGASADGRRLGDPISSDLSPAPSSKDREPDPQLAKFSKALAGYTGAGTDAIWDGGPTDFNIDEAFPVQDLVKLLNEFADGRGSNLLTITCASPETFAEAPTRPEKYDLLRVRMGGWSEFFTSMFPDSQHQHQRRPISTK